MKRQTARVLGFDLSTTALSCGVRSDDGQEDFVSVPMRGKEVWDGQAAHNLWFLPGMILEALRELQERGWSFKETGTLSFSVRQHDMVLLGDNNELLMPALSWQCNVAKEESDRLNSIPAVVKSVGRVEPRFILPKLVWVLRNYPGIASKVSKVMTTGDYITACLTGNLCLSTSDGLSNGLLLQRTKKLAKKAFISADSGFLNSTVEFAELFPQPIQSGLAAGFVNNPAFPPKCEAWFKVARLLSTWIVVSCLGDNHAGGVGCGLADRKTIVISAGSSGTVIRRCSNKESLAGKAACFEYYNDRLLLIMLADCAAWYNKFALWYAKGKSDMAMLDELAMCAPISKLKFWSEKKRNAIIKTNYPRTPALVASAQLSIALELVSLVESMLAEVKGQSAKPDKFVLTGGLSRSRFFQEVFGIGVNLRAKNAKIFISDRKGPLASQAATLGAMINAMVGSGYCENLASAISDLCPLAEWNIRSPGSEPQSRLLD